MRAKEQTLGQLLAGTAVHVTPSFQRPYGGADGAVRAINHANMMAQEVNWPVCREAMYDFLQNSWLVMDDDDDD